MAKITSYAKRTREITGLSKEQYTKEYDVFKIRVRNYNRATGSNLSASEQFYYYKKQMHYQLTHGATEQQAKATLFDRLADISKTTAQAISKRKFDANAENIQRKIAQSTDIIEHLKTRYRGILDGDTKLTTISGKIIENKWRRQMRTLFTKYENGKISLDELYTKTRDIANNFNDEHYKETNDALIGSD